MAAYHKEKLSIHTFVVFCFSFVMRVRDRARTLPSIARTPRWFPGRDRKNEQEIIKRGREIIRKAGGLGETEVNTSRNEKEYNSNNNINNSDNNNNYYKDGGGRVVVARIARMD